MLLVMLLLVEKQRQSDPFSTPVESRAKQEKNGAGAQCKAERIICQRIQVRQGASGCAAKK
jgi:hypothetical protein